MNINMINSIVRTLVDTNKKLSAFSFVHDVTIDKINQNKVTKINTGNTDFLVTDIQISIYDQNKNLVDSDAIDHYATINMKSNSSGWVLFSGGKDIQHFVPALNSNNRIVPFMLDKGSEYDIEINFEKFTDAATVYPIKITICLDGAKVV